MIVELRGVTARATKTSISGPHLIVELRGVTARATTAAPGLPPVAPDLPPGAPDLPPEARQWRHSTW